jgi:hypothetical protein
MCFRIHYLDRPREKTAQQRHIPPTLSRHSCLNEGWAALMAWLRRFPKPTSPVTATSASGRPRRRSRHYSYRTLPRPAARPAQDRLGLGGVKPASRAGRAQGNTHGLAIYIEKGAKPGMKAPGLLLAISMAVGFAPHASAVGCQYDMQCKGERICQKGQCVSPVAEDQNAQQASKATSATKNVPTPEPPARVPPATRNVLAPGQPAKAPPAMKNVPAPEQAATASPAMTNAPALSTEFRYCCTKVGKFPLAREPDSEGIVVNGSDTCHGITSYGTPLPGTPCN